MAVQVIEVLKPGLFTTVQDLGRSGYQQYGVVVSGAMDRYALQVSNLLVGNARGEAALEVTLTGPELGLLSDTVVAVCGADLSPALDGKPIPLWKSVRVKKGQILRFGQPKNGIYAYVAFAGGIAVPSVMGSKSTYVKGRLGGLEGRPLKKGDVLACASCDWKAKNLFDRRLPPRHIPDYASRQNVRVVLGPDVDHFHEESVDVFLSHPYRVTSQMDRMGYQLEGPSLRHVKGADIVSDGIAPGTIQVPASGKPMILMADRQTTGGYARIATVISVDLPRVAQTRPGRKLLFEAVRVEEAQALYVEQETFLRTLQIGAALD